MLSAKQGLMWCQDYNSHKADATLSQKPGVHSSFVILAMNASNNKKNLCTTQHLVLLSCCVCSDRRDVTLATTSTTKVRKCQLMPPYHEFAFSLWNALRVLFRCNRNRQTVLICVHVKWTLHSGNNRKPQVKPLKFTNEPIMWSTLAGNKSQIFFTAIYFTNPIPI